MHRLCHRSIDMSQEAAEIRQEAGDSRAGSSRQTADSEVAAAFAEELPAAIRQQSGSVSPSRLDRFNSLTKGESADGVRHGR